MVSNIQQIRGQMQAILDFLVPFLPLANSHMVDFFTKTCYKNNIPPNIQEEISQIGLNNTVNLILNNDLTAAPDLQKYVQNCADLTLKNLDICLTVESFIANLETSTINKLKLDIFMSSKKSHEVEILSAIAASISQLLGTSHLIDIGDGKGYLSSMLALHHKIAVLGVDASNVNTKGAVKRANKLSKVWNGIKNSPKKSYPAKNDQSQSHDTQLYKQITEFVTPDLDLLNIISICYPESTAPMKIGLVGLHTCGNLSPTSLKIFNKHDYVRSICNVGCCYHLLTERFEENSVDGQFPLSQFLSDLHFSIGRSGRMIANQSVDRILETKELPNKTIYYRALFQILLETYCQELPSTHVGKFKKCGDFIDYVRKAMKRISVEFDITDEEIGNLEMGFRDRLNELNVFYLLRCKLAPVIETLILLDKLLFLLEQGHERSFLVQLFDPVISPRCYGVIAIKENL